MLRTLDIVLMGVMVAAAVVTYSIKHQADEKLSEVRRLETEIKLEKDTIDLLRADWALLTQPNRLQRLVTVYQSELQLVPTAPTQLAQPKELPMLRSQLPQPPEPEGMSVEDAIAAAVSGKPITAPAAASRSGQLAENGIPVPMPRASVGRSTATDATITGSVNR